jgi:hypothetical protein
MKLRALLGSLFSLILLVVVASDASIVVQSGARYFAGTSSSFSYTPTHYVDDYAAVSGATSDGEDRGATAWSNATSPSTPTTIGTAMARATAGNVVRVAPGTYSVTPIDSRWSPSLSVANSGTSGSPIIFYAQYPGAYNEGSTSLYSEIRSNNSAIRGAVLGVVGGQDYIYFDGFVIDQTYTPPRPSNGTVVLGFSESTGVQIRRFLFLNEEQPSGDNYPSIYMEGVTSPRVVDSRFRGGNTGGEGDCVTMYGVYDFVLEHNELIDVRMGMYAKGSAASGTRRNYGVMRFNYASGVTDKVWFASVVDTSNGVNIYQNLGVGNSQNFRGDPAGEGPSEVHVYNNTFVDTISSGNAHDAVIWMEGSVSSTGNEFYNNIVANTSASSTVNLHTVQVASPSTAFAIIDYNNYYNAGSTLYFSDNQDNDTSGSWMQLTAWRTHTGDETNSITTDPSFVNAAGGNYRLNTGSAARTAGNTGGVIGAFITGNEEMGLRASPTY